MSPRRSILLLAFLAPIIGGCSATTPSSGASSARSGPQAHCLDSPTRNSPAEVTRPMLFFLCVQGP